MMGWRRSVRLIILTSGSVISGSVMSGLVLFGSSQRSIAFAQTLDLTEQLNQPAQSQTQPAVRSAADRLMQLGSQQQQQGQLDAAVNTWRQAIPLYQQLQDLQGLGQVYDQLGVAYAHLGRFGEADDALRRQLAIAIDRQDFQGQIYGLNNLGTLLLQQGNFRAAQDLFSQARSIAHQIGSLRGEGLSLNNLGLAAARQGDRDVAIRQFEEALQLRRRARDGSGEANTLNNLGDAYRSSGSSDATTNALRTYLAALSLSRYLVDRPNQFRAIDGLVAVYSTIDQPSSALALLNDRRTLAEEEQNPQQQLNTARLLAEFYSRANNVQQAQTYYRQAIELARQLQDERQEALLINQFSNLGSHR